MILLKWQYSKIWSFFYSWHLTFWNVPYKPFEKNEFQKNMVQKIHSKLHPVSYTNTHHDIKDLLNHGMVENTKTWLSWEQSITFLWNKKILNLCLRWHIMRSCHFAVEVTFNCLSCRYLGCYFLIWHFYLGSILAFCFEFKNLITAIWTKTSNMSISWLCVWHSERKISKNIDFSLGEQTVELKKIICSKD